MAAMASALLIPARCLARSRQSLRYFVRGSYPAIDGLPLGPCDTRHVTVFQGGMTLAEVCAAELGLLPSNPLIGELVTFGAVYCRSFDQPADMRPKRCTDPGVAVHAGDYIRLHSRPRRFRAAIRYHWPSRIVAEYDSFIVVDKPSGVPTLPSVDNLYENAMSCMEQALEARDGKAVKLWSGQRLDVCTSGLVAFGTRRSFVSEFNRIQRQGGVRKVYTVRCRAAPGRLRRHQDLGALVGTELVHWQHPVRTIPMVFRCQPERKSWRKCRLKVLGAERLAAEEWELHLELITGRTHQIRGQLHCEGWPVAGDRLYTNETPSGEMPSVMQSSPGLALRSSYLEFELGGCFYRIKTEPG